MARPKTERRSADVAREIQRLEEERKQLIESEDRRRGAAIRDLLDGESGREFRTLLAPLVSPRDAFLFGIEKPIAKTKESRERAATNEATGAIPRRGSAAATA